MEEEKKKEPDPGVFITKGMKVDSPAFTIRMNGDGNISSDPVSLRTGLDMAPYWIRIAYQHLLDAGSAHDDLMKAKSKNDSLRIGEALEKEFSTGMQTMMASAIAIDSYYASIREYINIPDDLIKTWREKRTARYRQIAEVLRRAFPLSQNSARRLREILKQNFTFRDKAIHPSYGTTDPILHPELNKVSDWRYATFRFYNANALFGFTISIIYQTADMAKDTKNSELQKYCTELKANLQPTLIQWIKKFDNALSWKTI